MVSRLDLDGTYSPMGLVTKILQAEPNLKIPVPIEALAKELDIAEIRTLKTDGFEGGLVTDTARSNGGILVKAGVTRQRRRFTIGHELCHFLIPFHKPAKPGQFLCDRAAMNQWDLKEQKAALKMEAEANRFSALLLMPPPHLKRIINGKRYPSLNTVLEIHEHFDVSKDAAARAYAEYNSESVAIVVARDGKYLRAYRNRKFPWIALTRGDSIPSASRLYTYGDTGRPSDSDPTAAEHWINTEYGAPVPAMYEQILFQASGFAMIQLKVLQTSDEDFDPDEDLTAKQRLRNRRNYRGS